MGLSFSEADFGVVIFAEREAGTVRATGVALTVVALDVVVAAVVTRYAPLCCYLPQPCPSYVA